MIDVGAAVEAGLDELDGAAKYARADEHGEQANAAGTCQLEGESREGYEVHKRVAALRRLKRPEHRDGQGERHGERGMSKYLRILRSVSGVLGKGKRMLLSEAVAAK